VEKIQFYFAPLDEFTNFLHEGYRFDQQRVLIVFLNFINWHDIVSNIFNISLNFNPKGIVISRDDSSKRHLVSPLSIKLNSTLLTLSDLDDNFFFNNNLFNIDKKFIIPQFTLGKIQVSFLNDEMENTEIKFQNRNMLNFN
jgi:hypothetical protein